MDIGIVSSRYAKALLRFAQENKEAEAVYAEMQQIVVSFKTVPAFVTALQNPILTDEKKTALLIAAANTGTDVTQSTQRFITLCVEKKRADMMQFIATSYASHYETANNLISGSLTVARPVSEKVASRLQAIVEARTQQHVELKMNIDPNIEGGFILQYGDNRMDASLRGQFERLRRELK